MVDTTQSTVDEQTEQRNEPHDSTVAYIRNELIQQKMLISDDDFRDRVNDWIKRSLQYTDADTAADYVESRLNGLLDGNKMYNSAGVVDGAEAFPDECSGCEHYGVSCPIMVDTTLKRARDRELADVNNERDARQVYSKQARDTGCQTIPKYLSEWDEKHSELVREGNELLTELAELVHGTDDSGGQPA